MGSGKGKSRRAGTAAKAAATTAQDQRCSYDQAKWDEFLETQYLNKVSARRYYHMGTPVSLAEKSGEPQRLADEILDGLLMTGTVTLPSGVTAKDIRCVVKDRTVDSNQVKVSALYLATEAGEVHVFDIGWQLDAGKRLDNYTLYAAADRIGEAAKDLAFPADTDGDS